MAKFVMAGGGTGGHVVPLLAVARELRERGHEVVFIGTREGIEAKLVPAAGYPIEWISIGGLKRVGWRRLLRTARELPASVWKAGRMLAGADAVLSLGGFVAGPVVAAAIARGTPVVAMEPNAAPGSTTRWTAMWVERALVAFEETGRYFRRPEVTGLPVREEFFRLPAREPGAPFTVLITGGSRGSRTLNRAFRESLDRFRGAGVRLLHQSGAAEEEECAAALRASGVDGEVWAFVSDMAGAFARADVVVCRSGAGAVAELAAAGKAGVLVPFPFAADDHQRKNAEAMERAGAARVVSDSEMNGERLHAEVMALEGNRERLARMEEAARRSGRPGAARRAAEILEETVRKPIDTASGSRNNNR